MFNIWDKNENRVIKKAELDKLGLFQDCNGRIWESEVKSAYRGVTITLTGITNRYGILRIVPGG